jgi:DNA-binding ferritin-like protein
VKAADFVGLLFLARDVTHSTHLNTRSYAKHKALQKFYENIIDLADDFAETFQGKHGLIGAVTLQSAKKTLNVTEFLEDQLKQIEDERYEICAQSYTPIQNIIDEIIGLYLTTLYKLKFLS